MIYRLIILFIMYGFAVVGFTATASAQTIDAVDLQGWAWSSNIGWISLNCENDACRTSDYKVTVNADRSVTGFAWSSNIGWIKFGGLSSFPTGGGTTADDVKVTGTYPNMTFTGWARACGGTNSPGNSEKKDCAVMTINDNSGNWDGWISFSGTNYSVKANLTNNFNNNSYAWGSDVVGWVDMFTHTRLGIGSSTASIIGNNCLIAVNASTCSTNLSWDIPDTYTSPAVRNITTGTTISTSPTRTNYPYSLPYGPTTIQARDGAIVLDAVSLVASCAAGGSWNGTRCIPGGPALAPTISLSVYPSIVRMGGTVRVGWSITNFAASTCTLQGPGLPSTVTSASSTISTGPLTSYSTVKIKCTGDYGEVEVNRPIDVIPLAQEV